MKCRILKCGECTVTQGYSAAHKANDIVARINGKNTTDYVLAHTSGTVVEVVKNYNRTDKTGTSYGNYVMIKHSNGYHTLYAHLKYGSVTISKGQKVAKGQIIGYMGNTGHSNGAHTHFEVRKNSSYASCINPNPYLNADLPGTTKKSVSYRVYCKGHWYATAKDGQTAGDQINAISGVQVRTGAGCGNTSYRVHIKGGKWLPIVNKWDDTEQGYAGIKGKPIDGFAFKSEKGKVSYRVKTKKSGWLSWVSGFDTNNRINGYAGNIGEEITAIQIKIV